MQAYLKVIYYLLLVAGFFLLLVRRKKLGRISVLFTLLYAFNIITQVIYDTPMSRHVNPFLLYHINQFISATIFHIYYYMLLTQPIFRKVIVAGYVLFSTYFVFHFILVPENIVTLDFTDFALEGLLVCIYVVFFLTELYKSNIIVILQKNPDVIISIGNLIFFSGCMFVMGFSNYLKNNNSELYSKVVYINYVLNILLYSLYFKAFLCNWKMKQS